MIRKRLTHLIDSNSEQMSDFDILSNLNKEIITTYPSIDYYYDKECNLIVYKIRDEIFIKCIGIFVSELHESSENNILYLI